MVIKPFIIVASIFFSSILVAESFVVAPQKKQPKITAHDCCHQILVEMKNFARIGQYSGQLQGIGLAWAEDYFEDEKNTFFKLASQEYLQECHQILITLDELQKQYEQGLRDVRDALKNVEQKVLTAQKKK